MRTAMVIGAGIVGACTAHYLSQRGWRVIVVERRGAAAQETTFANGGQLSACHSVPWSEPGAPLKVLRWLFDSSSPLCFRPRLDANQWRWLARFMLNCLPGRSAANTETILKLALYSRAAYLELFERLHIMDKVVVGDLGIRQQGILHFYRTPQEWARGIEDAKRMTELGLTRRSVTMKQLVKLEPALEPIAGQLVGGTYTASDMSGDAKAFTDELSKFSALSPNKLGVSVQYFFLTDVERLYKAGDRVGVQLRNRHSLNGYRECYEPDALILCTATGTNPLLKQLGLRTNIYPAKGYSATFKLSDAEAKHAPVVSLTDDELKVVYTRLQPHILRVAGTAELSGYDADSLRFERCQALVTGAKRLFPKLDLDTHAFWTGLRPLTPSNVPYICKVPGSSNLWLNTGHGSLGWTLGAGSGKLITELIDGSAGNIQVPDTSLQLDPTRFEFTAPR